MDGVWVMNKRCGRERVNEACTDIHDEIAALDFITKEGGGNRYSA